MKIPKARVVIAAFFVAVPLFATTPPPLPRILPPLQEAPPPQPQQPPARLPMPPLTVDLVERLAISGALKMDLLHTLRVGSSGTADSRSEPVAPEEAVKSIGRSRRVAVVDTTVIGTSQAVSDGNEDIEPAVIANRFDGIDRTTTAYMKYPVPNNFAPAIYWRSTTDFASYVGGQLPIPNNHTRSGDPLLAENPYTGGIFGKRTYCSGIAWHPIGGPHTESSLVVWWTTNPGSGNWSPSVVASTSTFTEGYFYDKPSVWVSWHTGTLGYIYVAAVRAGINGFNTIEVWRKTTGTEFTGTSDFTLASSPFSGVGISSPIITVDPSTGYVYLLYVDWSNNRINIARSTDMGSSFGAAVPYAAGSAETPLLGSNDVICDANNNNCLRGTSVLMARPNAADGSIGVVWHRREPNPGGLPAGQVNTDVYFNSFVFATQQWRTERRVNVETVRDQWNAALDPDANGNYLITFYDRRDDTNDIKYRLYGTRLTASGDRLEPQDTLVFDVYRGSAILQYTPDGSSPPRRYLGEYQDVWEWFGTWVDSLIYIPDPNAGGNGQGDVYLSRVQP